MESKRDDKSEWVTNHVKPGRDDDDFFLRGGEVESWGLRPGVVGAGKTYI